MAYSLIDLLLREVILAPYQTKGSVLTWAELDNNLIILAENVRAAFNNLAPWDAGTTYTGGELAYVSFDGNTYKFIKLTDSTNEQPDASPSSWELVSAGEAAMWQLLTGYDDFGVITEPIAETDALIVALKKLQEQITAANTEVAANKQLEILGYVDWAGGGSAAVWQELKNNTGMTLVAVSSSNYGVQIAPTGAETPFAFTNFYIEFLNMPSDGSVNVYNVIECNIDTAAQVTLQGVQYAPAANPILAPWLAWTGGYILVRFRFLSI